MTLRSERAHLELERYASRDRLKKARVRLRKARARWARARKRIASSYRSAKRRARLRFRAYRAEQRERVKREIAHWWAELRAHWNARRARIRALGLKQAERAQAVAEHEQERLRELGRHRARVERHMAEHRRREADGESDERVVYDLSAHHPELVPVFRKVRHLIHGSAKRSRTEAMLEWAHDHSDEVLAMTAHEADRAVREAVREHEAAELAAHRHAPRKARARGARAAMAGVPF